MADLVTTTQAAKALGISPRSLARWTKEGLLVPDLTTPGGHYRWDVERLREQIKALPARSADDE